MGKRVRVLAALSAVAISCGPVAAQPKVASAGTEPLERKLEQALAEIHPAIQVEGRSYKPATIEQLMREHKVPAVSIAIFLALAPIVILFF